ncbi:NTP transferase domain-containing protein [Rhodobacterales bacterium HKCCE2091]|nr:NTP transferase domain-containing protein [Rhodobacterales bacterium HKCCE2091]
MRGEDKLLRDVDGMPLLRLVATRACKVAPVRVVLAPGQDARAAALDGLETEIVTLPEPGGMSASLSAGVAGLKTGAMIVLADMPEVTAEDMATLAALWRAGAAPILRAAAEDGTPGHPVILPPDLLPRLAKIDGDRGAAAILKANAGQVALYPLSGRRAVTDLDTPEDWAAWEAGRPR